MAYLWYRILEKELVDTHVFKVQWKRVGAHQDDRDVLWNTYVHGVIYSIKRASSIEAGRSWAQKFLNKKIGDKVEGAQYFRDDDVFVQAPYARLLINAQETKGQWS